MRGSDGKRFDARVPLGRHFPLSRVIRGFFDAMATGGKHGVDGVDSSGAVVSACSIGMRTRAEKPLTADSVSVRIAVVACREAPGRLDSKLLPATASGELFLQA